MGFFACAQNDEIDSSLALRMTSVGSGGARVRWKWMGFFACAQNDEIDSSLALRMTSVGSGGARTGWKWMGFFVGKSPPQNDEIDSSPVAQNDECGNEWGSSLALRMTMWILRRLRLLRMTMLGERVRCFELLTLVILRRNDEGSVIKRGRCAKHV